MQVDVVSAQGLVFSGEAEKMVITGEYGELGIVSGHSPFITTISPGPAHIFAKDGSEEVVFVSGGILEVQPKIVTVLADTVIREGDVDIEQAQKARSEAVRVLTSTGGEFDCNKAKADLAHAAGLIKAIKEMRNMTKKK